ncbi:MAG TPA: hypothetical protein VNB91_05470 [Jatrophihabitantaceae bacterium]|nr:hypothetical protein [Jatrophihabitantaceae bacterium]
MLSYRYGLFVIASVSSSGKSKKMARRRAGELGLIGDLVWGVQRWCP